MFCTLSGGRRALLGNEEAAIQVRNLNLSCKQPRQSSFWKNFGRTVEVASLGLRTVARHGGHSVPAHLSLPSIVCPAFMRACLASLRLL